MKLTPPKVEDIKYFYELPSESNESIKQNILHYLTNFDKEHLKIFLQNDKYGESWKKLKDEVDELIINKLKEIEYKNKKDSQFNAYTFQIVKKVTKIIKEDYIIELYSNTKDKKSFYTENIKLKTKIDENLEYDNLIKEIEELCKS
jgi:hypothetical protein